MSIIIQYTSEEQALDKSKTGQLLSNEMFAFLKEAVADEDGMKEKARKITKILNLDSLPPQVINILIRPWYRAHMLASWWNLVDWSNEKERARDYLNAIDTLENFLKRDQKNISKLMVFMTSSEIDIDKFFLILEEIKSFYKVFLSFEFKNGKPCSAKYFIRYGINSLYYMAKKLKLRGVGRPTQLNQYLDVITQRSYIERNKDRLLFSKIDFLKEYDKKRNIPLWYIYNPYCKITNAILTEISLHQK